ncbi:hypothetical protein [Pseudomonas sp. NPDC089547]|uniref:hypothetical protein n=1 Tax=Pseudomonas sp. NPDC089547 TaxID=3390652 RepID=UPI003D01DB93
MLHTIPAARVASVLGSNESMEWRFVFLSQNSEFFYVTRIEWVDDEPVSEVMLFIGHIAELQLLLSSKSKHGSIGDIYLVSPPHVNKTAHWDINLLLRIEEIDKPYPGFMNINYIYTIDRDGPVFLFSDEKDGSWERRSGEVIYEVDAHVFAALNEEQTQVTLRMEAIIATAARLFPGDFAKAANWLSGRNDELNGKRPIDMTTAEDFDRLQSYLSE